MRKSSEVINLNSVPDWAKRIAEKEEVDLSSLEDEQFLLWWKGVSIRMKQFEEECIKDLEG